VDISEILFNELAFYKLMQDLDDPDVKGRIALNKWKASRGGETSTENSTGAWMRRYLIYGWLERSVLDHEIPSSSLSHAERPLWG